MLSGKSMPASKHLLLVDLLNMCLMYKVLQIVDLGCNMKQPLQSPHVTM